MKPNKLTIDRRGWDARLDSGKPNVKSKAKQQLRKLSRIKIKELDNGKRT